MNSQASSTFESILIMHRSTRFRIINPKIVTYLLQIHSFVAAYKLDQSHDSFLKIFVFFDKCSIDSLFLPSVTSAYIHSCFNIRMPHNSLYNFYIPSLLLQVYIDPRRSNGEHMSLILSSQFQKIIRGLRTCSRMKLS